jgi:hypothetical protein
MVMRCRPRTAQRSFREDPVAQEGICGQLRSSAPALSLFLREGERSGLARRASVCAGARNIRR